MASDSTAATTQPDELPLEVRKEIARLRAIMYSTGCVHLSTSVADGGRWLTDEFVMLDVTGSLAVDGVEDGAYKLTAGKGLVRLMWKHKDVNDGEPSPRPSELDADGYFDKLAGVEWDRAWPSEWSVAEHPGKAMLFAVGYWPALMGEETWTTLHKHYDDVQAEFATSTHVGNLFRILSGGTVVACVAGIRVPDGQEIIAEGIAGEVSIRVWESDHATTEHA